MVRRAYHIAGGHLQVAARPRHRDHGDGRKRHHERLGKPRQYRPQSGRRGDRGGGFRGFANIFGFDREAIEQALEERLAGERQRGGSTISQQTAKNVFLWQGGGWFRKGLEAWFTFWIEAIWGKRRIMEVYLNVAETGIGTYGAEAGAQRYFGKSAAGLSADEASRMAAALPSPKKRSVKNPGGWLARHGNSIERRIGIVRRDGLDACVYQ